MRKFKPSRKCENSLASKKGRLNVLPTNSTVGAFLALGSTTTFILPISDNGGSSSEIIRVMGGPSIGDIRSRLVRLIPSPRSESDAAIKQLLEYRLSAAGASEAEVKAEWLSIVEGQSGLWRGVPADRRETIRAFLVYFESELLKVPDNT